MFRLIRENWLLNVLLQCICVLLITGCSDPDPSVNIFCDVQSEVVAPLLDSFDRSHEELDVKRSSESVGKINLRSHEIDLKWVANYDLLWSSDLVSIAAMQHAGLLQSQHWDIPAHSRNRCFSPQGNWAAVSADARVLIVNTNRIPDVSERPTKVSQLSDPKWKSQCALANPLVGPAATHFAVLTAKDSDGTIAWVVEAMHNAKVLPTDKLVASTVASGSLAWGLTDSNSAVIEKQNGAPVEIVFPDQGDGEVGTLLVPSVVAITKNSIHPRNAKTLAEYLVGKETVSRTTMASGAQFNVRPDMPFSKYFEKAESIKWMEVDFAEIDKHWLEFTNDLPIARFSKDGFESEEQN